MKKIILGVVFFGLLNICQAATRIETDNFEFRGSVEFTNTPTVNGNPLITNALAIANAITNNQANVNLGTNLTVNGVPVLTNAWQNPASATNWTWTSDGTQITLTGYTGPNAVVIPDMLDGLPVTGFGAIFYGNESITNVSGGVNITSIAQNAFRDCTNLTTVILPSAINIGASSIRNCSALTSLTLPYVTSVGQDAFYSCTALTSVSLPAATSIGRYAFYSCTALTSVSLPAATNVVANAFYSCTALPSVSLPSATIIGSFAFYGCTALTSVYFGQNAPSEASAVYSGTTNVTNYVTNPTATGWGTTWNGRPVVRLPVYSDGFYGSALGLTNFPANVVQTNTLNSATNDLWIQTTNLVTGTSNSLVSTINTKVSTNDARYLASLTNNQTGEINLGTGTDRVSRVTILDQLISKQSDGVYLGGNNITRPVTLSNVGTTWNVTSDNPWLYEWTDTALSSDAKYQLIATPNSGAYKSSNYGVTWSEHSFGGYTPSGAAMSSDGKYQAFVGATMGLRLSTNYGSSFSLVMSLLGGDHYCIDMSADGKYMTVGRGPDICVSSDYGKTWTINVTAFDIKCIAMSSDGRYQIAGQSLGGYLRLSSDYGKTWADVGGSQCLYFWGTVSISDDGKYILAVEPTDITIISRDHGNTWSTISGQYKGGVMSSDGKYQTLVVSGYDYIKVSSDWGFNWSDAGTSDMWFGRGLAMTPDGHYQVIQNETDGKAYVSKADVVINGGLLINGSILPSASNQYDIGSSNMPFRHGYFGTNSLYLGQYRLSVNSNGSLTYNDYPVVSTSGVVIATDTNMQNQINSITQRISVIEQTSVTNGGYANGVNFTNVDAVTVGGLTKEELMKVGVQYYFTTNLISYGAVTGRTVSLVNPTSTQMATYTDATNGQYLATYLIKSNEMPAVLLGGVYSFKFFGYHAGGPGNHPRVGADIYIINATNGAVIQEFENTVGSEVPRSTEGIPQEFIIQVNVTNDIPKDGYAIVLKTKMIERDGYTGTFYSYFGIGYWAGFIAPIASGVYLPISQVGTAAYEDSTAFATAAQGIAATNAQSRIAILETNSVTPSQLNSATNGLWIQTTNLVTGVTNGLASVTYVTNLVTGTSNSLVLTINSATNGLWIQTTNLVTGTSNSLVSTINSATNGLWVSTTNLVTGTSNSLVSTINSATNGLWIQTTNRIASDNLSTVLARGPNAAGQAATNFGLISGIYWSIGTNGSMAAGEGINLTNIDARSYGAQQNGRNLGTMTISSNAHGAQQLGYNISGSQVIERDSAGAQQIGGNVGTRYIGPSSYGAQQIGVNNNGTQIITNSGYGAQQIGYNAGTQIIGVAAYGARQSGWNNWLMTVDVNAFGAQQFGYNLGVMTIGANAYGAMQAGYLAGTNAFATNNGNGAIQLVSLANGQRSLIESGGAGSILLGAGISSNRYAIVAGDNQVSRGDGSITAGGGFWGSALGLTNFPANVVQTNTLNSATNGLWIQTTNLVTGTSNSLVSTINSATNGLWIQSTNVFITNGQTSVTLNTIKPPNGFENQTNQTVSFNPSTRQAIVTPVGSSFRVTTGSKTYTYNTAITSSVGPNVAGGLYAYFRTSDGAFICTNTPWIIDGEAQAIYAYMDTNTPASTVFTIDERHGVNISDEDHLMRHLTVGSTWASGMTISHFGADNATAAGANGTNTCIAINDAGVFYDEDVRHTTVINGTSGGATNTAGIFPILYKNANGVWRKRAGSVFPFAFSGDVPTYWTGAGIETTVAEDQYFVYWLVVYGSADGTNMFLISHPITYSSTANAQSGATFANFSSLLGSLPSSEMLIAYRLIFQFNAVNPNANPISVKSAKLRTVDDYRNVPGGVILSGVGSGSGSYVLTSEKITAAGGALLSDLYTSTNSLWIQTTNLVTGTSNSLVSTINSATNDLWIQTTNLVTGTSNNLMGTISSLLNATYWVTNTVVVSNTADFAITLQDNRVMLDDIRMYISNTNNAPISKRANLQLFRNSNRRCDKMVYLDTNQLYWTSLNTTATAAGSGSNTVSDASGVINNDLYYIADNSTINEFCRPTNTTLTIIYWGSTNLNAYTTTSLVSHVNQFGGFPYYDQNNSSQLWFRISFTQPYTTTVQTVINYGK